MGTAIEWTDETWNPVVGCSRTSPGCDHCYAIGVAHRAMQPAHEGLTIRTESGVDWTGEVRCLPDRLGQPFGWKRPRRVFVNSMSDLFHPDVPDAFIDQVFDVMLQTEHTYQVLTKRPQRMAAWVTKLLDPVLLPTVLENIWLGTSIESDRYTFRADHLRATPAMVRFLSLEPLLGPLPSLDLTDIDWVIVGGESGPGARPMHPGWARDIRDRCADAGVPFLFKQWGSWAPGGVWGGANRRGDTILRYDGYSWPLDQPHGAEDGTGVVVRDVGKKAAGRELDGRTHDSYPEPAR